nr:MAG TPA: hypothetical protein [Caudoviricetes sp.]
MKTMNKHKKNACFNTSILLFYSGLNNVLIP